MLHKTLKTSFRKTLVILCTLALLIGAVYVPVGINTVFAANSGEETVVFDFTDACADATVNTNAKDTYGVGFFGWGPIPGDSSGDSTNKVLSIKKTATNQPWVTSSGYRLNKMNADGEYESYILEPSTSYAVSLKVRVLSSPSTISGSSATNETAVYIGYGAHYYSGASGNRDNYFNRMYGNVQPIIKSLIDSGSFKLYSDSESYVTLDCSEEWYTVNYIISTPESTNGKFDLSVWADMYTGINCEIDDVSVTKLGGEKGAVVLKDDYSGTIDISVGKVGDTLTLPDLSDRILEPDHSFEGWCKDEARTEDIAEITYEKAVQTVYSKWTAPVQITFVDTLNSTQTVVPGMPGEEIQFPTDPEDPSGEKWFMGWYTTEEYTEEFTDTEYGYSNVVVYSFFKGSIPGLTQDFENYPESDWTPQPQANGTVLKSNRNQFGYAFEKQSEVTYNNSSYAVKLDWDSTMTKTGENATNPEAYDAATKYNVANVFYLGGGLENKQSYVVTFKYKVEKADTPLTFQMISATYGNFYISEAKHYDAPVIIPTVSDEWQDGRVMFTTDYVGGYSTIFFKVNLSSNADTVIYFDDFEIQAFAQPYESVVVFDGQNGEEAIYCVGTRGEKIDIPTVTHPDEAVFKGWYLDKECTEEMDFDTFGRETVTVYAKWGSLPQNFSNYPYSTTNSNQFGIRTMSIDMTAGVGYNDSFALRFKFRGSDVHSVNATTGNEVYMYERAIQPEHSARVKDGIEEGKLYKITYKYKTESSNNEFIIRPYTTWGGNFWIVRNFYYEAQNIVTDTSSDWKEYTGYFVGRVSVDSDGHVGNALYLSVVQSVADMNTSIDLLIDNVLVEEVNMDAVLFEGNGADNSIIVGQAGDVLTLPTPVLSNKLFVNWYTDEELTKVFDAQTLPEGVTTVYAKWKDGPMSFKDYPYTTTNSNQFGIRTMSIDKTAGVGYNDDYALRFKFRGSVVHSVNATTGKEVYMYERAIQPEHSARVKDGIEEGKLYKITYKYKTESSNNEFIIRPYTTWGGNFWIVRNFYYEAENIVTDTSSDWKEYTGYFVGRVSEDSEGHRGNALYLSVVQSVADMNTSIDLLIDDVYVEECSLPFVKFIVNDSNYTLVVGEENGEIKKPDPTVDFGYAFDGWYLDTAFTSPFTQTVFTADTKLYVYAKQVKLNKVTYTFENYGALPHSATVSAYHLVSALRVKSDTAYSGDYVIEFDRRGGVSAISGAVIEEGYAKFVIEPGVNYVATVKYRIDVAANVPATIGFMSANNNNLWAYYANVSPTHMVSPTDETGVWKTVSLIIDSSLITIDKAGVAQNTLYVCLGGGLGGVFHIDDVTIEAIPQGTAVAYIHTGGSKEIPQILYGKAGESFANKLPKAPSLNGYMFKGYFTKKADGSMEILAEENMKFADKPVIVYATFSKKQIVQSFEENYLEIIKNAPAYSLYDFDFELYDKLKSGNSADNVVSGRYSMHRIGNSHLIESVSVLSAGDCIQAGSVYKLSFKVKVGKHLHTDGAIKFSNIKTYNYAWATSGDARAVVAIKDIADGQWHEVSYVFHSIESFAALQTPGYVELFIDDVTFTLMEDGTQVSQPIEFTEYVPVKRDLTTGEILEFEQSTVDISTIVDSTLREEDLQGGSYTVIYVSVAAGVVLIAVAAFIIIAILRKKKKNG